MNVPVELFGNGKLDPFLHLASDLSRQDRDLIHI